MFEKWMKICKIKVTIFFGALGFLFIDEKMYLVSQCHVKKIAVQFAIFFFNNFFYYLFMIFYCFFFTDNL